MRKKKSLRRLLCLVLLGALLLMIPLPAQAEVLSHTMLENLSLSVDGGEAHNVRALHYGYRNNRYVSLRDMAAALTGTARAFDLHIAGGQSVLTTGENYSPVGSEGTPFAEGGAFTTQGLALNPIRLDGRELRYLSFLQSGASVQDCYMSLTDLCMQLDLSLELSGGQMTLDTGRGFAVDLNDPPEGFYFEVHAALVGDASTGAIYASWEPMLSVPIASTSKLMSYVVVMDALADGEIAWDAPVTIPEEAAQLSRTPDAAIYLESGWEASMLDLLCGMLLSSSNECALALAIHTAGSEEAFVARMNRKAQALSLSEGTFFYNCNGLPIFTDNLAATKVQNRMSAQDMFVLVQYLLKTYPSVTEITSLPSFRLESLNFTAVNTNPLLYNLPGVVGLKTGTTNMSGACLVSLLEAEDA